MHRDGREYLLVAAQAAAVTAVLWPNRRQPLLPGWARAGTGSAVLAGGAVATAGARTLGRSLSPYPTPGAGADLHVDGVFRYVRHPIYAGVLLAAAGVALRRRGVRAGVGYAALAAVLHVKSGYEEDLLRARFGAAYDDYTRSVPRLVPRLRPH